MSGPHGRDSQSQSCIGPGSTRGSVSGHVSNWVSLHLTCLCRATCGWPSAQPGKALLIAQVDQLSGVRSTSSTLSVICLHLTHNGRVGEVSAVCTLDPLDVAAVTSSPGAREERLLPSHVPGSLQDTEYVGQLISAAVIDAEASLVSVLMHCGTMTRMFVVHVDTHAQEASVMSSVLGLENSLEVCNAEISKHSWVTLLGSVTQIASENSYRRHSFFGSMLWARLSQTTCNACMVK